MHRLRHGFAPNHARRNFFNRVRLLGVDRPLPIDGLTERIHHPANQFRPTGTSRILPVHLTGSPSEIDVYSPKITASTESRSRLSARPNTLPGNSSISPCIASDKP